MVRFATIGRSWIVDYFLEGVRLNAPDMVLSGVYSREYQNGLDFAKKYQVDKVYTELNDLANDPNIDAVYIASPNALHFEQAKLMLEHHKHVLIEKSCVVTSNQFDCLLQIADKNNLIFMEAIKLLHLPEFQLLLNSISLLGRIHLARFDFSRYSSKYPAYLNGESPNIFNPNLAAGALMDMGIYSVYPAVCLFGEPDTVQAHAVFLRTGADGALSSILGYSDKTVSITVSKMSQSYVNSTIQGDNGILSIDTLEHLDHVWFIDTKGNKKLLFERDTSLHVMGGEARDFYRYIINKDCKNEDYRYMVESCGKVVRTMEKIRKSANLVF